MYYHTEGEFLTKSRAAENKQAKKDLIRKKRSHGIIVYFNGEPVGWCQYGQKPELPRLDASRSYQSLKLDDKGKRLWRITCFFVDRNNRRRGIAGFGLNAALASIEKRGGGVVEAYPSKKPSAGSSLMWSGTVSMFQNAGFEIASELGKSRVVMRKTI